MFSPINERGLNDLCLPFASLEERLFEISPDDFLPSNSNYKEWQTIMPEYNLGPSPNWPKVDFADNQDINLARLPDRTPVVMAAGTREF